MLKSQSIMIRTCFHVTVTDYSRIPWQYSGMAKPLRQTRMLPVEAGLIPITTPSQPLCAV